MCKNVFSQKIYSIQFLYKLNRTAYFSHSLHRKLIIHKFEGIKNTFHYSFNRCRIEQYCTEYFASYFSRICVC